MRNDIRIWRQVDDGVASFPLVAGQDFEEGEVLLVSAASGRVGEAGDDPDTVAGISMVSSYGTSATGEAGMLADQVRPTGTLIQVYKPTAGQLFSASRFATDGAGTAVTPTQADVGDTAGFTFTGGNWIVDKGAGNHHVEIVAVIDANGAPIGDTSIRTTGTGVAVVFGFL